MICALPLARLTCGAKREDVAWGRARYTWFTTKVCSNLEIGSDSEGVVLIIRLIFDLCYSKPIDTQTILFLLNLFFGGILVGLEICAHYGFHAPTLLLDDKSQIRFHQAAVRELRWLVPAFYTPTLLSAIALTILKGNTPGYLFRYIGIIALLVWIALRATGTVPINAATRDWSPSMHHPKTGSKK